MRPAFTQTRSSHYYAPDTLTRPGHWGEDAACRTSQNPDIWFPEEAGEVAAEDRRQAKEICGRCPARPSCLTDALERGERIGVWGGLDPDERNSLLVYPSAGHRAATPSEGASGGPPQAQAATA